MMHKGDLSAKIDLLDISSKKHLYALGAIENLKGEIQIFDGIPTISSVEKNNLIFDNSFSKKACLLVYCTVEKWTSSVIPKK